MPGRDARYNAAEALTARAKLIAQKALRDTIRGAGMGAERTVRAKHV